MTEPRFADARLLLVDDEASNVRVLERVLESAGYRYIQSTTDSSAVLELVEELDPDLLLLDLMMPAPDGYAILDALADGRWGRGYRPVLVLTADATRDALERALGLGAHDFLTKPFDRQEVLLRIHNLLETRYLYRTLEEENIDLAAKVAAQRVAEEEIRGAQGRVAAIFQGAALAMVYQPIVDLADGRLVGVEALARFTAEPRRTPDVWFAEAALVGQAEALELLAVGKALHDFARLPQSAYLSVNTSPDTIASGALWETLQAVPLERIVVEITEHAPVTDYDLMIGQVESFRAAGGRLAIDDAGAGFASLRHILSLRPDLVKLDISLTRDIHLDRAKRALASGLISFAEEMGMAIVAEGIENAEEVAALRELGVSTGQGYFLGRPGPLTDD
ncbi:MAG TPA: EAL domain-containing response regulator [Candidatus Limnocylindrales bacterium]|nr:EAL domain-containing response regulator [Candidatus Limnocylindrales bacterium]